MPIDDDVREKWLSLINHTNTQYQPFNAELQVILEMACIGAGMVVSDRKMRAALLYGIRDLRVETVDVPDVHPAEVLVKVGAATTCGTEVKIYSRGYAKAPKLVTYPMVFGHEWAGEVAEVGEGVADFKEGMRVRAGNSAPCFQCYPCREGKYNLCENRTWLWGAYAEYLRVPETIVKYNMQEILPHVTYEEAAITEPLACVLHGARKSGMKMGNIVAIIGSGPIGIMHLEVAKRCFGASRVIISDLIDERLKVAESLGADEVINARREDPVERVRQLTHDRGADVVIEAVGLPQTWIQALRMVKKGGTVLEFGGCPPGTKIEVETELLHYGEVTLLGTFHAAPHDFEVALNLITSGAIDVKPLITRKMGLEEINRAFETLTTLKSDLKIAILP